MANTAFKKPSAYRSTPSFFICLMAFARLILASFESAVDIVSHKINALKRSGFRSMALKAMYPPIEKPQNIALSIFRWSSSAIKSSTNSSMVYCPSPTSLRPCPRRSYAIMRRVFLLSCSVFICSFHISELKGNP